LTAFVHLLNADGEIVAQRDHIPADGTRPTTGWLPGEIVADSYRLPLPPGGPYTLAVGLYDAASGMRIGERVILPPTVP
jgi:hypothetical protein